MGRRTGLRYREPITDEDYERALAEIHTLKLELQELKMELYKLRLRNESLSKENEVLRVK